MACDGGCLVDGVPAALRWCAYVFVSSRGALTRCCAVVLGAAHAGGGPAVPGLVCGTLLVVALIALVWVRQMPRRAGPTLAGVALFVLLGAVL